MKAVVAAAAAVVMSVLAGRAAGGPCSDPEDNATLFAFRAKISLYNFADHLCNFSDPDPDKWNGIARENTVVCDNATGVVLEMYTK